MFKKVLLLSVSCVILILLCSWSRPSSSSSPKTCEDCQNTYARICVTGIDDSNYQGGGQLYCGAMMNSYATYGKGSRSQLSFSVPSTFPFIYDHYNCHWTEGGVLQLLFNAYACDKDGTFGSAHGILAGKVTYPKIKCNGRKTKKVKLKYESYF